MNDSYGRYQVSDDPFDRGYFDRFLGRRNPSLAEDPNYQEGRALAEREIASETAIGPRFPGQKPCCPAGHYYPDVMRLHDEKILLEHWRVLYCRVCGTQRRERISPHTYSETPGCPLDEFEIRRARELSRMQTKAPS